MTLAELRTALQKKLGILKYTLSDDELIKIIDRIKLLSPEKRSEAALQEIVTSVTGLREFRVAEALDMSDTEYLIQQIEAALKNKKK